MYIAFHPCIAHLVVLSLPQKAEGVRGIVLAEKTKTSSQYFAGVQKLAVLDLGLVLLPVNSQSEAASLLAQLVLNNILLEPFAIYQFTDRGLPLITYASRGGGGVNTNAYKCVQGGRGGLNMTKNTHFVRRFIENPTISDTFKLQILPIFSHKMKTKLLTPFKNVISIT